MTLSARHNGYENELLLLLLLLLLLIIIKAASSDERALAVHACRGMLLSGCAAALVHATLSIEEVVSFIIWWLSPAAMK